MKQCQSAIKVTRSNFHERAYLDLNTDVKRAVEAGTFKSGYEHFLTNGKSENRLQANPRIYELRQIKNSRLKKVLKRGYDKKIFKQEDKFNFLTPSLKEQFNLVDTPNVSSHNYDLYSLDLIKSTLTDGLVLDCGAGYRNTYYANVVNFEIVDYSTTDVLGVAEKLPFRDNSFEAVVSIAVFEHVKDPFKCAAEIARVLKPGGSLYCAIPFLQPFHGYPHHYFNMTKTGAKSLFEDYLRIDKQAVIDSYLPLHALCWIINSWAEGLGDHTRSEFLKMTLQDFYGIQPHSREELSKPFVRELSIDKNFELAAGTVLHATKPLK
jgi:SAM-dependent methyltransferase